MCGLAVVLSLSAPRERCICSDPSKADPSFRQGDKLRVVDWALFEMLSGVTAIRHANPAAVAVNDASGLVIASRCLYSFGFGILVN